MKRLLTTVLLILATVFFFMLAALFAVLTYANGAPLFSGYFSLEATLLCITLSLIGIVLLSTSLCCLNLLWQRFRNRRLIHTPTLPAAFLMFNILMNLLPIALAIEGYSHHEQSTTLSICLSIIAVCSTIFYTTNLYCKQEEVSEGRRTNSEGRSAK